MTMDLVRNIDEFFSKHGDPRVEKWLFMSSPFYTLIISASYIFIVKIVGPKWMEKRQPFQLKNAMLCYNLFQVLLSTYLFFEFGMAGWFTTYSFRYQPIDYSDNPDAIRMARVCHAYYLSKFTELLDTVFFVLRKKFDQVSGLHVFHHATMVSSLWIGIKMAAGGHLTFFALLNSFVHIVMYGYYFLSAFGPKMKKYLWWKKYLTTLQMVQFIAAFFHTAQLLFIESNYSRGLIWIILTHATLFYYLFNKFYHHAYVKQKGG